jgi:hypothetical protein
VLEVFKKSVRAKSQSLFSNAAGSVGVNEGIWQDSVTAPLTVDQIRRLQAGTSKLFVLTGATWRTEANESSEIHESYWCEWITSIGEAKNVLKVPWHNCE